MRITLSKRKLKLGTYLEAGQTHLYHNRQLGISFTIINESGKKRYINCED